MASRPLADSRRKKITHAAIAHAESTARDPRLFVDALRNHGLAHLNAAGGGGRGLSLGLRPKTPKGARLADDPRYLANVRELARRTKRNARIIGGSTVTGKEFADCVAIGDDQDFGCTGTLIAPNVVLTAGHCQSLHSRIFVGNDLEKKGTEYRIAKHVRHPQYTNGNANDVMLLILEKPVKGVKPRALAPTALIDAAIDARVVGFGTTDLAGTVGFGRKQQTDVPIVSQACKGKVNGKGDGAVYGCHLGREIVAGKPLLLHDTCKGDSGGPLYVADAGGRWLLAGVTSRGTDLATTMCGDGGLYVRVDQYRDWLTSAMKNS
jgi:secreted trypsin-like serine protease